MSFFVSKSRDESFDPRRQGSFDVRHCKTMHDVASIVVKNCWSPISWNGGLRKGDNFLEAGLCALDFDSPNYSLRQCITDHRGFIHLIGTTKSHQKEKRGVVCDRFRLVIPFMEVVNKSADYKSAISHAILKYQSDEACSDLARFYYPCKEIVSLSEDGQSFQVMRDKNELFIKSDLHGSIRNAPFRTPPGWVLAVLRNGVPLGSRHHTCLRIAVALSARGFSEEEILKIICQSPFGCFPDIGFEELTRTISNAVQWVQEKMQEKQRNDGESQ